MQTFWDLTEKERAALTESDVEQYINAELMLKGVLRAKPPEIVPEPDLPQPDQTVFVLSHGYHDSDFAFTSADQAAAVLHAVIRVGASYISGKHYDVVEARSDLPTVKAKQVYSSDCLRDVRSQLERATAARAANEKARTDYESKREAERKALEGLWENWHECRERDAQMRRIADTFAEYVKIAGDAQTAARFLAKAFSRDDIVEAATWCGVSIPDPGQPEALPAPAPLPAVPAESIPF